MKRIIEKKVWPEFFKKIVAGDKTFEVRLADFKCQKGDTLVLKEWDPKTKKFTSKEMRKKITYVIKTKDLKFWTKKEITKHGLQIIAFR